MLKFFINIIGFLTIFSFLFGINFSILKKNKNLFATISVALISFIGLVSTFVLLYLKKLYPQKMVKYTLSYNRWALSEAMILMGLSILILLYFFIFEKKLKKGLTKLTIFLYQTISFLGIWLLGFTILQQVFALTQEFVAFGETSFGTQSLIRLGGYVLGIIVAILIALSTYKVAIRLKDRTFKIFSILLLLVAFLDFLLRGVSALARLRILKARNPLVFEFMIWEDKSLGYILALFTLIAIIFSLKLFMDSFKVRGTFKNNAMFRIEKARLIKNKRWSKSLITLAVISLISVTVIHKHITKPVELSPPEEYQVQNNFIIIPLETVDDGHLHRFSYIAEGGHNIRFIVVKKPRGGSYGVGLDACDICGVAGYFERNDEVVCKRCDVVMNKATIGFRGGCNPVPFKYEIKEAKIIIDKAVLDEEKDRFPVGE